MNIRESIISKTSVSKEAARKLSSISTDIKNNALLNMAKGLRENAEKIVSANSKDLKNGEAKGLSPALLDRLMLDENRINDMAIGLEQLVALKDPIGEVLGMQLNADGLQIGRVRVPLGVIGIIYEARPNVTVDAAGLCLKSGNAVVLRGGSEAINSNIAIIEVISKYAYEAGIPNGAIQFIDVTDREAVNVMLKLNDYLDVIIPRGGAGLIKTVVENSTVPVIETGTGNCHVYVDSSADLEMAKKIVINGKTHRPGVCNATESLLVHKDVANELLPAVCKDLQDLGVEIRGCDVTLNLVNGAIPATDEDYGTEFLDFIISVKVVDSIDEAIEHIYKYGTKHSEVIVTENYNNSRKFQSEVDAAAVYVNASSRFTDGFQFGFGAEIGISTQKLHARGPMGLTELTTTKYIINGSGQIRK
ncbi:glutamate-5-semialdehyde dehydrogenase [Clostridium cylindrosporum]|uniref:Gamma-glutamyl phosphate reductase n=1 Tax=Clostridium cylindrosporum DSM 605 TaxID=1121307 RepID=A0A0J8D600_CLOCY|nr:glutamate-5-semialdehyde dehydrogenase [Clostridium cylindrosporum]KMT21520.1 gamma-glutamyl phosphate reductase ProA [Clostridium cylindrosporum DSM 605]